MARNKIGTVTLELKDHDRLYVEFAMSMNNEQFDKYSKLPRSRKDYLFDLWYQKNYQGKPLPEADNVARNVADTIRDGCASCGRINGHYIFCDTLPKNQH